MEKDIQNQGRRQFLKTSGTCAGGLVIAFVVPHGIGRWAFAEESVKPNLDFGSNALPNAFVKILPDDTVHLIINKLEMGQGVLTSLSQLIAEELECDWKKIQCELAPVAPVYNHTLYPTQMTGGSTAIFSSWEQHRKIGAMAREMLVSAAAKKWNVPNSECHAKLGAVHHSKRGSLSYGKLANAAAQEPAPADIRLKDPKHFNIIGKSMPRLDAKAKSTGQTIFGLDVIIPNLQYAVLARPPFGAKLKSYNAKAAKQINGVTDVIVLGNRVAVVGKNTWAAKKGRDALDVKWDQSKSGHLNSTTLMSSYKDMINTKGIPVATGDADEALGRAHQILEFEYEFPYLAHACMEPLNCTVDYDGKTARMWSGHQMPTADRMAAAKVLGLSPDKIQVTTTFAGGGFGRRGSSTSDFAAEACEVAKELKKPVKVVWMREDDMKGGYYRPMFYHHAKIGLDSKGAILGWKHQLVGQSIMANSTRNSVEGVSDTAYAIPNFAIELHSPTPEVPVLWWRSVGHTHTAYVMETLIDEIAIATNADPLALRKRLLAKSPRHLAVLTLLEKASNWAHAKPKKGHAFGLAIHESFRSVVGHVVDVSVNGTDIRVHRVTTAVDCGTVINPEGAKAQIASAIVFGLSACLNGEITLEQGQVVQNNFHDYLVLRMNQMPKIDVHFVANGAAPTGLGEPGLPPIAPAVANAVFRLTGKRLRKLPFRKSFA